MVRGLSFRVWGLESRVDEVELEFRPLNWNLGLGLGFSIWVVVKIMVPFWVPNIIRHLLFRVPKNGP